MVDLLYHCLHEIAQKPARDGHKEPQLIDCQRAHDCSSFRHEWVDLRALERR